MNDLYLYVRAKVRRSQGGRVDKCGGLESHCPFWDAQVQILTLALLVRYLPHKGWKNHKSPALKYKQLEYRQYKQRYASCKLI